MLNYTFDDIEDYLNGSIENRESFELAMELNPELKNKVRLQQMANDLIIENRLLEIENLVKTHASKPSFPLKKWLTGLGFLALVGATLFFLFPENEIKSTNNTLEKIDFQETTKDKTIETTNSTQNTNSNPIQKEKSPLKVEVEQPQTNIIHQKEDMQPITSSIIDTVKKEVANFEKVDVVKKDVPKVVTPADPCKNTNIIVTTNSKASCYKQENGYLQIVSIEGGLEPYSKTLRNETNEEISNFTQLASGKYKLEITDKNGCKKSHSISIENSFCEIDDSFNPSIGEIWSIPSFTESGILTIRNTAGNIVLEKEIPASETTTWDGKNKNGEIETGYFLFFIQYKSGSKQKGSVTLVR